jgi:hypothetical protein
VLNALDERQPPVVGTIGWRSWAIAAAVLLAGVLATVVMMGGPDERRYAAIPGGEDPVSVLVLDVSRQLDGPLVWRGSFDRDTALTTLRTLAELFGEQPDPAIRG